MLKVEEILKLFLAGQFNVYMFCLASSLMILPPQAGWMNGIMAKSKGWFILVWSLCLRWRTQCISIVLHLFCWSIFLVLYFIFKLWVHSYAKHADMTRNGGAIMLQMTEHTHNRVKHHTATLHHMGHFGLMCQAKQEQCEQCLDGFTFNFSYCPSWVTGCP